MVSSTDPGTIDGVPDRGSARLRAVSLVRRGLGSHALTALVDQAIFNGGNFLRGVILARMVSQSEFGLFTLGWTVIVILASVHTTLVATPYTVYSPRLKGAELARFTGSALVLPILLVVPLALVGVFVSLGLTVLGSSPETSLLAWAITIGIVPILLRDYLRQLCFARLWMRAAIAVDLTTVVVQLGLLLALGAIARLSAAAAFVIIGAGCLIVTVSWVAAFRREFELAWSQVRADWDKCWFLGRWGLASAALWVTATNLYPWLLAAHHGTGAAGVWAACLGVVALCYPLLWGLQNFILPKAAHVFAESGPAALRSFVPRGALTLGGLAAALCVLLAPVGGWLVTTLYGDPYSGNGRVVAILLANFAVLSFDFCFSRGLFILERTDVDFKINILPVIVAFTIGVWVVAETGVLGAAVSLLIGNSIALISRVVVFYRVSGGSSEDPGARAA
jgi:O-antigen/teichoic acid export membrane protein